MGTEDDRINMYQGQGCPYSFVLLVVVYVGIPACYETKEMGVAHHNCDDGVHGTLIDWNPAEPLFEKCNRKWHKTKKTQPKIECLSKDDYQKDEYKMHHKCFPTPITYTDQPPRSGHHRPLWPKFGDYSFCPPQRWLHAVEHGAAIFLYHPCAPEDEINEFLALAQGCIYRRVSTPYRHLPRETPFAIVTYGCRIMLSSISEHRKDIVDYVRTHALRGTEHVNTNGQYDQGLRTPAKAVSGVEDKNICPQFPQTEEQKELEGNENIIDKFHG